MKKILLAVSLFMTAVASQGQTVTDRIANMDLSASELAHFMAPGWNLGNTMEATDTTYHGAVAPNNLNYETSWQPTKTTQAVIDMVKNKGYKSIRIPCAWYCGHYDGTTGKIDADWMSRVKEIVDYCINDGLYVELNDHWDGGWLENSFSDISDKKVTSNSEILKNIWTQIATVFKDYDEHLLFAGANEPAASTSDQVTALLKYYKVFIDAVRATGGNNTKRVLVIQGACTDIDKTDDLFPAPYDAAFPSDDAVKRLMVEIHFYGPYQFAQMEEDATWGKMWYYWGVGHTLSGGGIRNYNTAYGESWVKSEFAKMKTKYVDNGVPVLMGEYGATRRNLSSIRGQSQTVHDGSVEYWYKIVTDYAMEKGLIPFAWDVNSSEYSSSEFNRSSLTIYNKYMADGISAGTSTGNTAYSTIYPEPTVTGIRSIVNDEIIENGNIYNIYGQIVKRNITSIEGSGLTKGIYVKDGKKYIVK